LYDYLINIFSNIYQIRLSNKRFRKESRLIADKTDVGRPLVGLLNGNEDSLLYCPGDPQGASLHFQQYRLFSTISINF
jgi:hypothetical protein